MAGSEAKAAGEAANKAADDVLLTDHADFTERGGEVAIDAGLHLEDFEGIEPTGETGYTVADVEAVIAAKKEAAGEIPSEPEPVEDEEGDEEPELAMPKVGDTVLYSTGTTALNATIGTVRNEVLVDLEIQTDSMKPNVIRTGVVYDPEGAPGTWSWPAGE